MPKGTKTVDLNLVAWGAADTRSGAPKSHGGFLMLNHCTANKTGFCAGVADYLVSGVLPPSGLTRAVGFAGIPT